MFVCVHFFSIFLHFLAFTLNQNAASNCDMQHGGTISEKFIHLHTDNFQKTTKITAFYPFLVLNFLIVGTITLKKNLFIVLWNSIEIHSLKLKYCVFGWRWHYSIIRTQTNFFGVIFLLIGNFLFSCYIYIIGTNNQLLMTRPSYICTCYTIWFFYCDYYNWDSDNSWLPNVRYATDMCMTNSLKSDKLI